jgi:hypothetical protein
LRYFNNGLAARQLAILELIDDDTYVFTNIDGVGPIDLITVNIKTKEVQFIDSKADNPKKHRKRDYTELQKELGVKHMYINLKKGTKIIDNEKSDLKYELRICKKQD